jgi:hypothetical protein
MIYRIQKYTVARLLKTEWVFEKPKVAEAGEMMSIPMRSKPAEQKPTAEENKQ